MTELNLQRLVQSVKERSQAKRLQANNAIFDRLAKECDDGNLNTVLAAEHYCRRLQLLTHALVCTMTPLVAHYRDALLSSTINATHMPSMRDVSRFCAQRRDLVDSALGRFAMAFLRYSARLLWLYPKQVTLPDQCYELIVPLCLHGLVSYARHRSDLRGWLAAGTLLCVEQTAYQCQVTQYCFLMWLAAFVSDRDVGRLWLAMANKDDQISRLLPVVTVAPLNAWAEHLLLRAACDSTAMEHCIPPLSAACLVLYRLLGKQRQRQTGDVVNAVQAESQESQAGFDRRLLRHTIVKLAMLAVARSTANLADDDDDDEDAGGACASVAASQCVSKSAARALLFATFRDTLVPFARTKAELEYHVLLDDDNADQFGTSYASLIHRAVLSASVESPMEREEYNDWSLLVSVLNRLACDRRVEKKQADEIVDDETVQRAAVHAVAKQVGAALVAHTVAKMKLKDVSV